MEPSETTPGTSAPVRLAVARETLDATPARVLKLLRGIGSSFVIRSILLQVGFTRADLDDGWSLLREACFVSAEGDDEVGLDEAAAALRNLDAWDERGFVLVEATLTHRYPSQVAYLLRGLTPNDGAEAAAGVAALLDRLDALESDPLREEQRDDDHAALHLLASRGLNGAERARLRADVERVQHAAGLRQNTQTEPGEDLARLVRLRAWYDEWAAIARVTLTRVEHLQRLGLVGERR